MKVKVIQKMVGWADVGSPTNNRINHVGLRTSAPTYQPFKKINLVGQE